MTQMTHQEIRGGRILVVDDHARARESMADILCRAGHIVETCSSAREALQLFPSRTFDVVITDLKMPGMDGLEFLRVLAERRIDAQIVLVTAHATVASAVQAMRHGAFDYIEKPFSADRLEQLVARALRDGDLITPRGKGPVGGDDVVMIGGSAAMATLRRRIAQVAPTDETVLITGESGTGKELVARSIHAASRRAAAPLVSFNCPALSPQLMESELFGHERGAFTGADAPRIGRFELADHGTVLLDEVTEIELPLQAKLLRVLQERQFERVGSSASRSVDVRVLATTNRDLLAEVDAGRFRKDLYFRLAVVPIHVPPLRERPADIGPLIENFLAQAARRLERPPCQLDPYALELLTDYHWPGNVRELENIVTRASVLAVHRVIGADDLRPWLIDAVPSAADSTSRAMPAVAVGVSLEMMERKLIEVTLSHFNGHRQKTAQALGIGVRTLANKLRAYGYGPRSKPLVSVA